MTTESIISKVWSFCITLRDEAPLTASVTADDRESKRDSVGRSHPSFRYAMTGPSGSRNFMHSDSEVMPPEAVRSRRQMVDTPCDPACRSGMIHKILLRGASPVSIFDACNHLTPSSAHELRSCRGLQEPHFTSR